MSEMITNSNSKSSFSKFKNLLPILSIVLLTGSLLVYFGIQQFSETRTQEGDLISDLYLKTLKPLFTNDKLTKEDVLNFALYNNLPIDKVDNKIIEIKNDDNGNEVIEVRNAEIKDNTDNYSRFIEKMELSREQKNQLDSLLEEYKQNITNTIFSDNNKTLAVDSRIGLLHGLLRSEIFDFIAKVKSQKYDQLASKESSLNKFKRVIEQEKNKSVRNYIFFTPDTVLHTEAEFTQVDISEKHKKGEVPIPPEPPIIKVLQQNETLKREIDQEDRDLVYNIDSNLVKVVLDESFFEGLGIEEYHELKSLLDSTSSKFELSIGIPSEEDLRFSISAKQPDSNHQFQFELNLENLGKLISNSIQLPENPSIEDWEEFGIRMDSLSLKLQEMDLDTLDFID
ncbi:MAG: hypothetical protein ABFS12_10520 [Bacteroidota bacterium]